MSMTDHYNVSADEIVALISSARRTIKRAQDAITWCAEDGKMVAALLRPDSASVTAVWPGQVRDGSVGNGQRDLQRVIPEDAYLWSD